MQLAKGHNMATYVIGDVHGCFQELQQLLSLIKFDPQNDKLWFTGDLINGGPQPLETLRFIKSLGSQQICVLGNHDLVLLGIYAEQLTLPNDRKIGFEPVLNATDCTPLLEWLKMRPLVHFDANFNVLLVHAGVLPQWSLEEIQSYAKEVENVLRSANAISKEMFGDLPDIWSAGLEGFPRLRFLINCFTRMRFCSLDGQLDLINKGTITTTPGFLPWFKISTQRDPNLTILFGHWATLLGKTNQSNAIALDTGCVWGHQLTALRLEDRKFFTVPGYNS